MQSAEPWSQFLPQNISRRRSSCRYTLGLFFVFCHCVVWIACAILTQFIYAGDDKQLSPFLMTFTGMALLVLYLPVELWKERHPAWIDVQDDCCGMDCAESVDSFDADLREAKTAYGMVQVASSRVINLVNTTERKRWNHKTHILAALHIAPGMVSFLDWIMQVVGLFS